jgi:DNA polymerase-1
MNPRLIVCWGGTALKAVLNDHTLTIKKARRKVLYVETEVRGRGRKRNTDSQIRKIPVVVTYHPAAVLRDPTKHSVVVSDLREFDRFLSGKSVEEDPSDRIYVFQGKNEDLGADFGARDAFAFDFETTRLSPFATDSRILGCAVSAAPLHAHAFAVADNLGSSRFAEAMANHRKTKVGHNLKFDLVWAKKNGYEFEGSLFDTMVAWHLIDENYPDKSLEHLALLFTGLGPYGDGIKENRTKEGFMLKLFSEQPDEFWNYVCCDADATWRLYRLFEGRLKHEKLLRPMRLYMETLRTLVDVELAGMYVDTEILDAECQRITWRIRKITKKLKREFPSTNFRSPAQVALLLYDKLHAPRVLPTDTGKSIMKDKKVKLDDLPPQMVSTSKDALEGVLQRTDSPRVQRVVRRLLKIRAYDKQLTGFLTPLRDKHLMADGCVHSTFNLTGTVTGRLSSDTPNMQNVPKRVKKKSGEPPPLAVNNIKNIFVSRWEDGLIIDADLSQIEYRVMAHYCREPAMIRFFQKGGDFHAQTAALIFNKKLKDVSDQERYAAKTVNFAVLYGIGPGHLARMLGLTFAAATQFIKAYFDRFPKLRAWIHKTEGKALVDGYGRTLFGMKRRVRIDDPRSEEGKRALRQIVNSRVQGSAGQLTFLILNEIHSRLTIGGYHTVIVCTVHDSIVLDAPRKEVPDVIAMIQDVVRTLDTSRYKFELRVPIEIDIAVGESWGKLKEIAA